MPQPRKYRDAAERQRAYRRRKKMQGSPVVRVTSQDMTPFVKRVQSAGEDAIEAFFGR